jgi:hypothetical protein
MVKRITIRKVGNKFRVSGGRFWKGITVASKKTAQGLAKARRSVTKKRLSRR